MFKYLLTCLRLDGLISLKNLFTSLLLVRYILYILILDGLYSNFLSINCKDLSIGRDLLQTDNCIPCCNLYTDPSVSKNPFRKRLIKIFLLHTHDGTSTCDLTLL